MISFENIDDVEDSSLLLRETEITDDTKSIYIRITNVIHEIIEYIMNFYSDKPKGV